MKKTAKNEENNKPKAPKSRNFDAEGHRINRDPKTDHRTKCVVGQTNPNLFRAHILLPLDEAAKAMQYVRGREVEAKPKKGCVVRKEKRAMNIADLLRDYLHALTKNIVMDAETLAWYNTHLKHNQDIRARQDALVAAGLNRIPKDQQMKRGVGSESYKARMASAKNKSK